MTKDKYFQITEASFYVGLLASFSFPPQPSPTSQLVSTPTTNPSRFSRSIALLVIPTSTYRASITSNLDKPPFWIQHWLGCSFSKKLRLNSCTIHCTPPLHRCTMCGRFCFVMYLFFPYLAEKT